MGKDHPHFPGWSSNKPSLKAKAILISSFHSQFTSGLYAGYNSHVLVDTWMLTVKLVYKRLNVPDDLKWATNTHMTPFRLTFKV